MEIINNKIDINIDSKIFSSIAKKDICFFDIETTGFSREKDLVYLVGIIIYDSELNQWIMKQLWIDSCEQEKDLVDKSIDILNSYDYVINYNGYSFDIPFLNEKSNIYKLNKDIDKNKSFDIYKYIRKYKSDLPLNDMKLESIERFLGINRTDIYSGYECIKFYKSYLKTNNKSLKNRILQHNYDDLYYLAKILKIIDIINQKNSVSINTNNASYELTLEELSIKNNFVNSKFKANSSINLEVFESLYKITNIGEFINVDFEVISGVLNNEYSIKYIYHENFPLGNSIDFDNNGFNLPKSIIPISIDGKILKSNILNINKEILTYCLSLYA